MDVAAETAREMVVYHRRSGGQSQFSALQDLAPDSERMRAVLEHIRGNLGTALTVEQLAGVACVSPRQFLRSFKAETGETPAKAVERIRAETARADRTGRWQYRQRRPAGRLHRQRTHAPRLSAGLRPAATGAAARGAQCRVGMKRVKR